MLQKNAVQLYVLMSNEMCKTELRELNELFQTETTIVLNHADCVAYWL